MSSPGRGADSSQQLLVKETRSDPRSGLRALNSPPTPLAPANKRTHHPLHGEEFPLQTPSPPARALPSPADAVFLGQHLPVLALGAGGVEGGADPLPDRVRDLEGLGAQLGGEVAVLVGKEGDVLPLGLQGTGKQSR